jgi:hypothetical protein
MIIKFAMTKELNSKAAVCCRIEESAKRDEKEVES